MRIGIPIICAALLMASTAGAAEPTTIAACQENAQGQIDYERCVRDAPKGSIERVFGLINLGTQAFVKGDHAGAVRFYDEAAAGRRGDQLSSDASFHAYRASAYEHVGRFDEALKDAKLSLAMLRAAEADRPPAPAAAYDPEVLLPYILPILKRVGDPDYEAALAVYRALPAKDWISMANRTAVLMEVGDLDGAFIADAETRRLAPDHPAVLNNACYLRVKAGRAQEGLPFCRRALDAAPDVAAIHDSHASALAALGRCREAETALATARRLDPSAAEYQRPLDCKTR